MTDMKYLTITCALISMTWSSGVFANYGMQADDARLDRPDLSITDASVLLSEQSMSDAQGIVLPRARRWQSTVSATASADFSLDGSGSDQAVHTRVQTCEGVSVTITSFGGGDWDRDLDAFCDDSASPDSNFDAHGGP